MNFEFILTVIPSFLQVIVVWYAWKVLMAAEYLRVWKIGWLCFIGAFGILLTRRLLSFCAGIMEIPLPNHVTPIVTAIASCLFLVFIFQMKKVFTFILYKRRNGEREDIVPVVPGSSYVLRLTLDEKCVDLRVLLEKIEVVVIKDKDNGLL